MICKHCGATIDDNSTICTNCGERVAEEENKTQNAPSTSISPETINGFNKFCIVGFILGVLGLVILYAIIMVGLCVYGRVYLFDGYAFTAVLSALSIIFIILGLVSLFIKAVLYYSYGVGEISMTVIKRILIIAIPLISAAITSIIITSIIV